MKSRSIDAIVSSLLTGFLNDLGFCEESRQGHEVIYRRRAPDHVYIHFRKDRVNEISFLIWFPDEDEKYSDIELCFWAGIPLPNMVARDPSEDVAALNWAAWFLKTYCVPILTKSQAAVRALEKAHAEQSGQYMRELNRRSAQGVAELALKAGAFQEIVRALSPYEAELDDHYMALLKDARKRLDD